jgi:TRAP-type C4-dicarboxylate transport system permease large subunit
MITPPVGLNCFIVGSSLRGLVPLTTVFKGVIPFILTDLFALGLLIAFPAITLWLPSIAN